MKIKIPAQLRDVTGGQADIVVDSAATVGEVIEKLGAGHPELRERLLDESGQIRRFINIYVGDEDIRFLDGLDTSLEGHEAVSILPAVAGG